MAEEAVKVAVRVRPFNSREKEHKAQLTIQMKGNRTTIINPKDKGEKHFTYDFSYWSHDDFEEQEDGYLSAASPSSRYCSQSTVFEDLGQGVLKNAYEGYNCSLFAYGQTGSGKSYSMVGYDSNKGIVPMTCEKLFQYIEGNKNEDLRCCVSFSMMEIYMEKVRDLLASSSANCSDLPVRQSDKHGFYVQGLKKMLVSSYGDIELRMKQGTARRTIASTNMNETSSRAHTVVTIVFDQIKGQTKRSSVINLVDLAGSERQDSTGAVGDRLKEGAKINQSLSTLGKVISVLAQKSRAKMIVPYRESVLTKLLMNALGGNSKTIMIAALSPADINYGETLSTLQYADRVKSVKTIAVVNENPLEKLIRDLRGEIEALKERLKGQVDSPSRLDPSSEDALRKEMEETLRAEIMANIQNLEMWESREAFQQKLEEERKAYEEAERTKKLEKSKLKKVPHLINVNEDPALSGILLHYIESESVTVGTPNADAPPNIVLRGLSICAQHAVFCKEGRTVDIRPGTKDSKTLVNGLPLADCTVLKHRDRILFGSNHLYLFLNPLNTAGSECLPKEIDWSFAQEEIAEAKGWEVGEKSALTEDNKIKNEKILELLPLVSEVNAIARELGKNLRFEVTLPPSTAVEALFGHAPDDEVFVKMENTKNNNTWLWDHYKFINRRFLIEEAYQQHVERKDIRKGLEDPFWEDPKDIFIGAAFVVLQSLLFGIEHTDKVAILDVEGSRVGTLDVHLTPTNMRGDILPEAQTFIEDYNTLISKAFSFKVSLRFGYLDLRLLRGTWNVKMHYRVFEEPVAISKSIPCYDFAQFKHEKVFHFPAITQRHLDYFYSQSVSLFLMREPSVTAEDILLKVGNQVHRSSSDVGLSSEDCIKKETNFLKSLSPQNGESLTVPSPQNGVSLTVPPPQARSKSLVPTPRASKVASQRKSSEVCSLL